MSHESNSGAWSKTVSVTKALKRFGAVVLAVLGLAFAIAVWAAIRMPIQPPASPLLVNDVSQL